MVKYNYCLFDLDGTLTDPGIGITNSVMYALEKFNIRVSDRKELYPFIGPPLVDSFMKYYGFTEKQSLQAVEYYREYFCAGVLWGYGSESELLDAGADYIASVPSDILKI